MSDAPRKPAAFRLEPEQQPASGRNGSRDTATEKPADAAKAAPAAEAPSRKKPSAGTASSRKPRSFPAPEIRFEEEAETGALVPAALPSRTVSPRFRWGAILASAVAALLSLWASVSAMAFIEDLFARSQVLGWIGAGLLGVAVLALAAIGLREVVGLWRVRRLGTTQADAARAVTHDDAAASGKTLADLRAIYDGRADMRWAMSELARHDREIMDPSDRVRLAERDLMGPLDEEAARVIARAARRVSVVTAVAPASLDILFTGSQNLRMLRELATLYGGRPGTLGTVRLAGMVASHLAVTGGLAMSDTVIQHVIGRGLIGRLSARFGEGAINGILTARIGLAAIDLCRPLPFLVRSKPGLADFAREVVSSGSGAGPVRDDAK